MLDIGGECLICVVPWHNQLQDTCAPACVSASIVAGSGLGHEHLHTRPADVLLPNWVQMLQTCSPRLHCGLAACMVQPILLKWVPQQGQLPSQQKEGNMTKINLSAVSLIGYVCVSMESGGIHSAGYITG